MADTLRKVEYFYTLLSDAPGQGAKVLAGLAAEGVNLLAFSGFPAARKALVPENAAALKQAAKKLGIKLSAGKKGFLLQGDDRVGAMTQLLDTLAGAKINVTAMDAVTTGDGRFGAIFWVKPQAVARTAKLLGAQ